MSGGIRTEQSYFTWIQEQLKVASIDIDVESEGFNPGKLLEAAISLRNSEKREAKRQGDPTNVYDRVWVVTDVDEFDAELPQVKLDALKAKVDLVISNPCFEVWLNYHHDASTRPVDRFEAQSRSKKLGIVDIEYPKRIVFEQLVGRFEKAEKVAVRHRAHHVDSEAKFPHDAPSTRVDELVRSLLDSVKASNPEFLHQL